MYWLLLQQRRWSNMEFEKIKSIILDILDVDEDQIFYDSSFVDDLDADSLDVYRIITNVEYDFGLEISIEEEERIVTVGDVVELVNKK